MTSDHDHGSDLPTKFLSVLFFPIYFLASSWDFIFSRDHGKFSSWKGFSTAFSRSWNKETGISDEETVEFKATNEDAVCADFAEEMPADAAFEMKSESRLKTWPFEQAAYRIQRHKDKCLQGDTNGEQTGNALLDLKKEFYDLSDSCLDKGGVHSVGSVVNAYLSTNKHSFFLSGSGSKTETGQFLEELPNRVSMAG